MGLYYPSVVITYVDNIARKIYIPHGCNYGYWVYYKTGIGSPMIYLSIETVLQ